MANVKYLKGILKLKAKIRVKTGLHIGGAKEDVEIGGIDNIVVKLKVLKRGEREYYDVPYIPGSSLKGKLRSLLEWVEKSAGSNDSVIASSKGGKPCDCGECRVCKLFGAHQAKNLNEPVRLRVEDFYPTDETLDLWERVLEGGYVEVKVENMIDRIKGVAQNPRHTERVIPGSEFEGYITLRVFDNDGDGEEFLKLIRKALDMLEDDYLGGSGSRGYGRVEINIEDVEFKKVDGGMYRKDEDDPILAEARKILKMEGVRA